MNAFCFVGLDIGRYNIAVCIIDEAETNLIASVLRRLIKATSNSLTNYFNSNQMG